MRILPSQRAALVVSLPALAVVALAWVFIAAVIDYQRGDTERDAYRQNANLALALEQHIVRAMGAAELLLQFVRQENARHAGRVDKDALVEMTKVDADLVTTVAVTDALGWAVSGNPNVESVNVAHRDYFRYHRDHPQGGLFVGAPVLGQFTGKTILPVSRRIDAPDGSFGVAAVGLNAHYFGEFYGRMDIGRQGLVLVVGLDGITRGRRAGSDSSFGQDMSDSTLLREQASREHGSFLTAGRLEGVPRYMSYRTLRDYGLVIAVATSQDEVLAPFIERRSIYLGSGAVFTLLVLCTAALMLVGQLRRQQALDEHLRSEARFRATFEQPAIGVAHSGLDGRFLRVNRKLCTMLGYSEAELAGRAFAELTHPEDRGTSEDVRRGALEGGVIPQLEKRYVRQDGTVLWAAVTVSLVRDPAGKPDYFIAMIEDITERKLAQEALLHQARHDSLTGLANRALFYDRAGQALKMARRSGAALGMMFMDLDRFKEVNDRFGHAAGDALLRAIAARLRDAVRESDTAARVGGDEFAVLLSRLARAEDAALVAEKILKALAAPIDLEGVAYRVTISIGIAVFPADGDEVEALVRSADGAMFNAKQAGRNRFAFASPRPAQAQTA